MQWVAYAGIATPPSLLSLFLLLFLSLSFSIHLPMHLFIHPIIPLSLIASIPHLSMHCTAQIKDPMHIRKLYHTANASSFHDFTPVFIADGTKVTPHHISSFLIIFLLH